MDNSISQDIADLKFQLQKLIVVQENAIEKTVITLIAGGNVLLVYYLLQRLYDISVELVTIID